MFAKISVVFSFLISTTVLGKIGLVDTENSRSYLLYEREGDVAFRACREFTASPSEDCNYGQGLSDHFWKTQYQTLKDHLIATVLKDDATYVELYRIFKDLEYQKEKLVEDVRRTKQAIALLEKRAKQLTEVIALIETKLENPDLTVEERLRLEEQKAKLSTELNGIPPKIAEKKVQLADLKKNLEEIEDLLAESRTQTIERYDVLNERVKKILAGFTTGVNPVYTSSEINFKLLKEAFDARAPKIPQSECNLGYVGSNNTTQVSIDMSPGVFPGKGRLVLTYSHWNDYRSAYDYKTVEHKIDVADYVRTFSKPGEAWRISDARLHFGIGNSHTCK